MPAPILSVAMGLAQYAPQIMRWLGAGQESTAVAERVVQVAQAVTGTGDPSAALERMRADAAAQAEFTLRVQAMSDELERDYLADRQDARRRDVAIVQAGKHNVRADLMVVGAVVGLLACLGTLVFFKEKVPGEVVGIVSTVAGLFGACLRDAFAFEFGSSRGSREKDAVIAARAGS
jgi:hypothetical protein